VCYIVQMLRLVHNKKCSQPVTAAAPQCILLYDRLMTVGRSYKADVKIMLPFISRKHFSVRMTMYGYLSDSCRVVTVPLFPFLDLPNY